MANDKTSYFDPLILARIGHLQLRAKQVVEGWIAGLHRSRHAGYSTEFAQHRQYSAGDELKTIDWKVYGRSDRFFVKQFEEETNLRAYIVLDASGSMSFKGEKSFLSKYDYAAVLAVSLSYLALHQGDSVGLGTFSSSGFKLIPARNSLSHLKVLLEGVQAVHPQGNTTLTKGIETISRSVKKRSLFILISDLFDESDSVLRAIRYLQFKKNEVWVVHLLDPEEKDFPYSGTIQFDSLENQERVVFDSERYRKDYQIAIQNFIERYRFTFQNYGVKYLFQTTEESLDKILHFLLSPAIG